MPAAAQSPTPTFVEAPRRDQPPPQSSRTIALVALVMGFIALGLSAIPVLNVLALFLALAGLVLGVIAIARRESRTKAIIAVVVSALSLAFSVVLVSVYVAQFVAAVAEVAEESVAEARDENLFADTSQDGARSPVAAEAGVGTPDAPAPIDSPVEIVEFGETTYEIVFGPSLMDASDAVNMASPFNQSAPEGFRYAVLPAAIRYVGSDRGTPFIDFTVEYVSASGSVHSQFDAGAVPPAPALIDLERLTPGKFVRGNVLVLIPAEESTGGTWRISTEGGQSVTLAAD